MLGSVSMESKSRALLDFRATLLDYYCLKIELEVYGELDSSISSCMMVLTQLYSNLNILVRVLLNLVKI